MGQGAQLNVVNVTSGNLARGYCHSYQMTWDSNLPQSIEALSSSGIYVEWGEGIWPYRQEDDAAEARYGYADSAPMFEIQARWRHLQVSCLDTDRNLVLGVLPTSDFTGEASPAWYPLEQGRCYDLGWNHDGQMTVALLDLRLMFAGSELDHYAADISTLTGDEQKKLYAFARAWAGFKSIDWDYHMIDVEYENPKVPQGHSVDIATESNIDVPSGVVVRQAFSHTKSIADTFSWGLKETLAIGWKKEWSVGIPNGAGTKSELSINFQFEANQNWSNTVENTYLVQDTFELSGPGKYNIRAFVDYEDNLRVAFNAISDVSAKVGSYPAPGSMVKCLLEAPKRNNGFSGGIRATDEDGVVATLAGSFKGTYGIQCHVIITKADSNEVYLAKSYP